LTGYCAKHGNDVSARYFVKAEMDIIERLELGEINATDDAIAEIERLREENSELREKVVKLQHWIDLEHEED
jgi:hypothetical protein